jgi:uncharacterized membrane protein
MANLIAIGYPDETTAEAAACQARRLAHNLIIQPDAIAVIVRDERGSYPVHTSHHPVGTEAAQGTFAWTKATVRELRAQRVLDLTGNGETHRTSITRCRVMGLVTVSDPWRCTGRP